MPAEVIDTIFEVIEGGSSVEGATIIEFPTDVIVGETLSGTTTNVTLGNGVATEVSQLTVETAAGATETAGVGLLAVDVGVAGAAAAPVLGILAGIGLYNLAPEFWTAVADKLWEAGETVGGKIRAYLNPKTKQVGLSQTTLEIFKKAFLEAGLFDKQVENITKSIYDNFKIKYAKATTIDSSDLANPVSYAELYYDTYYNICLDNILTDADAKRQDASLYIWNNLKSLLQLLKGYYKGGEAALQIHDGSSWVYKTKLSLYNFHSYSFSISKDSYRFDKLDDGYCDVVAIYVSNYDKNELGEVLYTNLTYSVVLRVYTSSSSYLQEWCYYDYVLGLISLEYYGGSHLIGFPSIGIGNYPNLQPDATYPTADQTIPETYHNYIPWELPETLPLPSIYPVEIPVVNPNPNQEQAQNPEPLPDNQSVADWLIDNLPQPDPVPNPPSDGGEGEPPDPPDPNPDPDPGPLPVIPVMPDTVNAHKMFTVYNPTLSQLNDFGGWLWTSDIIDNIVKIWAGDPIQGILSLRKVYAKPVTGSMKNIVVGYLDSGVDALEVSNQFVTIECGTVQVAEQKHNATDYPPYTSLHLYLPFIGVVELDPNEFMNGSITVTYHVDVYTGSCLAEVKATRSADMPNATILYTFTGNASQELPLSSSNFSGAISSLVSLATAGIAVASGGGLIAAGATASAIHSLTHEMIHINRSGNLSSNAGIMGSRIPYLIIGMRHGYDANAYNELYGYPANKTVYIGNCKGYTRVKAGRLRTKATEAEKKEIMQLLEKGVIL